jgi:putative transposase
MIAFIDDPRAGHGVEPFCRVLPIAPSTHRGHAAKRVDPRRLSARASLDAALQADQPVRLSREGALSCYTDFSTSP